MKSLITVLKGQSEKKVVMMILALTCLGIYGLNCLVTIISKDVFSYGFVSVMGFAALYIILQKTYDHLMHTTTMQGRKKRMIYVFIMSFLFAVSLIMGYQLRMNGMMESGFKGKALILFRGACLSVCLFPFWNYLFYLLEKSLYKTEKHESAKKWKSKHVFLAGWGIVFLCWVPVFLAYYPAIMAYDFRRQFMEAYNGFAWFNNYQPLAHTWLIWVALQIGYAANNLDFGMACYSIFQMLIFSAACAYSAVIVYRISHKKWAVAFMLAFFGAFPLVSVLALSVTKDILFSALFLVFVCLFVERTFLASGKKRIILDVVWVLEGILMALFRNNAIYAVAVFAVIALLLAEKKQKIRLFIICLLISAGGKGALEGVQLWIGTQGRGSKVEMFSVPIQTFSRVGYYHANDMDDETYEMLDWYVPAEFWKLYTPTVSDSVKNQIGQWVYEGTWKNDLTGMFKTWIKIGLQYPNEYIDAFLLLNSGYWFIDDVSWAEVWGINLEYHMGALSTYKAYLEDVLPEWTPADSKLPGLKAFLENIVCGNNYYNWPIISVLFKPALYSWGLLFAAVACFYINDKKKLLVISLPLVYLATMFLGPVVQARYMLPLMVVLPLMLAVLVSSKER